jgi:hypothetical protein
MQFSRIHAYKKKLAMDKLIILLILGDGASTYLKRWKPFINQILPSKWNFRDVFFTPFHFLFMDDQVEQIHIFSCHQFFNIWLGAQTCDH